jgi:hypothetical protein
MSVVRLIPVGADTSAMDSLADLHRRLADDGIDLVLAGLRGPALETFTRSDLGHDATPAILHPTVRQAVAASGLRAKPVGHGEDSGA